MDSIRICLTPDSNGTFLVTCPALPEVTTFGADEADAQGHAVGAIEEALAARMAKGLDIPVDGAASPGVDKSEGRRCRLLSVDIPMQTQLKIGLYDVARVKGVTRAELARRLDWHREQVDRLFRLDHASRFDQIEAAFIALKTRLAVKVEEIA